MKLRILLSTACVLFAGLAGIKAADNQQRQAGSRARLQAVQLSEEEIANIQYMWQEEKLARDVYLTLYEEWHVTVFANISESEQRHMDAIGRLIELYDINVSVMDTTVGAFEDPFFAGLYEEFVDSGTVSLLDALIVGVSIEEQDIADLTEKLAQTTIRNVRRVFENLLAGSERHLAAFQQCIDNFDTECQQTCDGCGEGKKARGRNGTCKYQ